MKVGDRILAINGNDVASCNLMEAVDMLRHSTHNMTSLVVEYDVSYMGASYGISRRIFTRISSICISIAHSITISSIVISCKIKNKLTFPTAKNRFYYFLT